MKKKIATILTIAVITVLASYNVYCSKNETNKLTSLTLANVEALAYVVEPGYWYECTYYGCLYDFRYDCHVYQGWLLIMTCENSRG